MKHLHQTHTVSKTMVRWMLGLALAFLAELFGSSKGVAQ